MEENGEQENLWKKSKKQKMSVTDVLYSIFDGVIDAIGSIGSYKPYKISTEEYLRNQNDKSDIRKQLYYLKKRKLIKSIIRGNEHYYELTREGHKQLSWKAISMIEKQIKWDKAFRIVMFDVPESKKDKRNVVRAKLKEIGFVQFQKSVFVFPFDCKKQIDSLCYWCGIDKHIKYMVVKITEGEEEMIEEFLSSGILTLDDLE